MGAPPQVIGRLRSVIARLLLRGRCVIAARRISAALGRPAPPSGGQVPLPAQRAVVDVQPVLPGGPLGPGPGRVPAFSEAHPPRVHLTPTAVNDLEPRWRRSAVPTLHHESASRAATSPISGSVLPFFMGPRTSSIATSRSQYSGRLSWIARSSLRFLLRQHQQLTRSSTS